MTCGICGRSAAELLAGSAMHTTGPYLRREHRLPETACSDCLGEWYNGETDPAKIRETVLTGVSSGAPIGTYRQTMTCDPCSERGLRCVASGCDCDCHGAPPPFARSGEAWKAFDALMDEHARDDIEFANQVVNLAFELCGDPRAAHVGLRLRVAAERWRSAAGIEGSDWPIEVDDA